jgi:transcriptional regulator with XRE-family HTH domain
MATPGTAPHIGRKIERIRMIRGIKQETLATALGLSQGAISRMEHTETIEDDKLATVANALGVSVDDIKNFDETTVLGASNYFSAPAHFQDHSIAAATVVNNFNPIDKIVELYERLLDSERKRIELLESKLNSK